MRILLADDDADYANAFRDGMQAHGHDVGIVHSGEEVLMTLNASRRPFDIVFLDMLMPDGVGASALHGVKQACPELPVVILTGQSAILDSPLIKRGLRLADVRLHKSEGLRALAATVAQMTQSADL